MKTWIKKHFAITDKGAGDIVKAIISSFLLCVANFLPAMLLLLFLDELVLQNLKNHSLYIIFSITQQKRGKAKSRLQYAEADTWLFGRLMR